MAKAATPESPTTPLEGEVVTAPPQTKDEIAATEQALGLAPAPKTNGGALAVKTPVKMGIAPTTLEEGWRMAQFFAQSDLVPKQYRGRPADVLVAIQYGMEVGLPPAAALHSIMVTNGRPSLWGDGFLAVIMASPVYRDHDEYYMVDGVRREFLLEADLKKDDTTAVCTFWRKGTERWRTATFSIAKAKKAGLWTKAGPWQEYPDRMLKFRARGFAGHDCFPDVLRGVRTAEEVIDVPVSVDEPARREVRRISETPPEPPDETPATPAAPAPAADERVVVAGVKNVEAFLGGFLVLLTDGTQVVARDEADAVELEKFKGTDHQVSVTYRDRDGERTLDSFRIAD